MEKAVVLTIQTSSSRLQLGVVCPLYFHDTEHFTKVASRRELVLQPVMEFGSTPVP